MRETKVRLRMLKREDGKCLHLRYMIVEEQETVPCYGIRVEEEGGDNAEFRNITGDINRIGTLFCILWKGGVTPVTLRDVLEDWL